MILNKGDIIYFGYAWDSVDYYGRLGYECVIDKNPIDYFMDIAIKSTPETNQMFIDFYN